MTAHYKNPTKSGENDEVGAPDALQKNAGTNAEDDEGRTWLHLWHSPRPGTTNWSRT